jgi:peptidoglycan hydrolase CwlO-like protein
MTLILILIFFMMYLIIQHFITDIEGLANCNQDQHDLTYKNTATVEQQQKEINDFKKNMETRLSTLQTQVKGFNTQITKNKKDVTKNATVIKSTVSDINDAKNQKAKELDKAGGGI